MKSQKTAGIIYYVCAALWYVSAAVNLFVLKNRSLGVVFLCIGSAFLCLGSLFVGKYREKVQKENTAEESGDEEKTDGI